MKTNTADNKPGQLELFELDPSIKNLGIVDIHISGGIIRGSFSAATEANDITLLTPDRWAGALAEYLIKTCKGDRDKAHNIIDDAFDELQIGQFFSNELVKDIEKTNVTKLQKRKKED